MSNPLTQKAALVDRFFQNYFQERKSTATLRAQEVDHLLEAMVYSCSNGGKRFRPALALLTADLLDRPSEDVLPFGAAVEMIHTYSLVHDDLPCMDNDDERRGQPTNHKIYGEDIALLAGDALLTEAFHLLVEFYQDRPSVFVELQKRVVQAAGWTGMIGGQAIDLQAQKEGIQAEKLLQLHAMKTGALIALSVEGAAIVGEASNEQRKALCGYGQNLGLAFQIADDVLDEDEEEAGSFLTVFGKEATMQKLTDATDRACKALEIFDDKKQPLLDLAQVNKEREK